MVPTIITVLYASAWWFTVASPGLLDQDYRFATAPTVVWLIVLVLLSAWRWLRPATALEHSLTLAAMSIGTLAVSMWVVIWLPMLVLGSSPLN